MAAAGLRGLRASGPPGAACPWSLEARTPRP